MSPARSFQRFLPGFALLLIVLVAGFAWVSARIPTWGATMDEIAMNLPGDEIVPQPQIRWDHAITIAAPPAEIYPWLIQMGDSRGAFYSYAFIENFAMQAARLPGRYVNADRIHPEWQDPPIGQGMIMTNIALNDYAPGEWVLASATKEMPGVFWTWLWYLKPVDADTTRLIVRHRISFPEGAPISIIRAVFNAGYVMERGMILGIRERAEGRVPSVLFEPLSILLWLAVLVGGIAAAVRFIRRPGYWHPLGIGLEAVIFLFIFTFIQPPLWLRLVLLLVLAGSLVIAFRQGPVRRAGAK